MTAELSRMSGAITVMNHLQRSHDPSLGLEESVVRNPYFEIARALLLERAFVQLRPKKNENDSRPELGEA